MSKELLEVAKNICTQLETANKLTAAKTEILERINEQLYIQTFTNTMLPYLSFGEAGNVINYDNTTHITLINSLLNKLDDDDDDETDDPENQNKVPLKDS